MDGAGSDETEFQSIVCKTFGQLDLWLGASSPFRPAAGSELRIDDQDWLPDALSQIAFQGLCVAAEHLQAVRLHIDSSLSGKVRLFPLAHLTLCRTALVGAAQAVWLLAPDDRQDRLCRHRALMLYIRGNHAEYLRGLQALRQHAGVDQNDHTDEVADRVGEHIRELKAKRLADGETAGFRTTAMIREAATSAFSATADPDELVKEAVLAWRSGSGAAHGFYWQLLGGPGTTKVSDADSQGVAEFSSGGSFAALGQPYMAAFHLCDYGWKLLRRRGL